MNTYRRATERSTSSSATMTQRELNERFKQAWFKHGDSVRYIGTQLKAYTGQVCRIDGWHGNGKEVGNGLYVISPDGARHSISYKLTEPVR